MSPSWPPGDGHTALTGLQVEVIRMFFSLAASERFLLAGGAALVAQHLTERTTQDIGLFTRDGRDVPAARDELERAFQHRGWTIERIQDTATFCRLHARTPRGEVLIDLALDAAPGLPATASLVGPTYAPEDLAGRKLLALFDRAEARDFADVFALAARFGKDLLLDRAAALDAGFDRRYLAGQCRLLLRSGVTCHTDQPLPIRTWRPRMVAWSHTSTPGATP